MRPSESGRCFQTAFYFDLSGGLIRVDGADGRAGRLKYGLPAQTVLAQLLLFPAQQGVHFLCGGVAVFGGGYRVEEMQLGFA